VKEMMFGFEDEFEYLECADCGCLQILNPPIDMSKYYPEKYYSFRKITALFDNPIKSFVRHQRAYFAMGRKTLIGKIISGLSPPQKFYKWFEIAKVDFNHSILAVGCGNGERLITLRKEGFSKLTGIDPYIKDDILYGNGVKVHKMNLSNMHQKFDFIMLNHSFEHMNNPLDTLNKLHNILNPNSYLMIRIPIASSFAFHKYGAHWVQIDAPRHCFLHTPQSMKILAEKANLHLKEILFDSYELQFLGSEQYLKGIHLRDENSYYENPEKSIFTKNEIQKYRMKSAELNREGKGDQAAFFLHKPRTAGGQASKYKLGSRHK
jgi:2-polyprenyl-3-methyl-5-hydroxy-6-metoxy-1,4-benzoquinol methylase